MVTRRTFLKAGLLGSAALAGAGAYYGLRHTTSEPGELGVSEREIVAVLVPVMLAGVIPVSGEARRAAIATTVEGVDTAVAGLSAQAQKEIAELFALLNFAPARAVAAGIWTSWAGATPDQVATFLERWRMSRFALLRSAYAALHDLVLGAWYGDPQSWPTIAYPGPPPLSP